MSLSAESIGHLSANVVLLLLAITVVTLRFITRIRTKQALKSDDWAIFVSLLFCIGLFSSFVYVVSMHLYGVPWSSISATDFVKSRKVQLAAILICHFVYGLIKISVVLFYKRIFTVDPSFNLSANIVISAISIYMIVSFFTFLFSARGVSTFWTTPAELEGTEYVINPSTGIIAFAAVDVTLDLAVLSLPFPIIKSLHLSWKRKVAVASIFLLGAFCLVCSVVRLYYTHALAGFTGSSLEQKRYLSESNDLWAHIEAYASVFTACLPTLRPLFTSKSDLRSLIGKVRSVFSLRSTSEKTIPLRGIETGHSSDSGKEHRAWYQSTAVSEPHLVSSEFYPAEDGQVPKGDVIVVKDTFGSYHENSQV
ncbi:hypothetical protein F4808DRAFT_437242 [Astrocystis sublimbata]|nr:hypothetical protein F4808DRAFT_437242 [Astrocystis sublimbata]